MGQLKLTERTVAQLKAPDPSGKQTLYWDTQLRGFAVLVSGKTAAKTYVVQRRLPNGRPRRITIEATNGLPLDSARAEAENLLHNIRLGLDPKAARRGSSTLAQTLEEYLSTRKSLREKSRSEYRKLIESYLSDWLTMRLHDLSPDMVEKRHLAIQQEVAQRAKERSLLKQKKVRALSSAATSPSLGSSVTYTGHATANSTMVALRVLWNFAAERDPSIPSINPVRRLRRAWFQVARRTRRVPTERLPAFYNAVCALKNSIVRDFLLLLLFTGMRKGEAARLLWDDIDLITRVIRLRAQSTKSNRKVDLPMSDFVSSLLEARKATGIDGPFVFPGGSISGHIEQPRFALKEVERQTGICVSPHDLRRTFLDVAESTEMSVYALKALVNHSAGNDVTAGYLGMTTERLRTPAQKVADKMKDLCRIDREERFTCFQLELVESQQA